MKTFETFAQDIPGQSNPGMDLRDYQGKLGQGMQRLLVDVARIQIDDAESETERLMIERFHQIISFLREMNVPLGYIGK